MLDNESLLISVFSSSKESSLFRKGFYSDCSTKPTLKTEFILVKSCIRDCLRSAVPNLFIDRAKFLTKKPRWAKKGRKMSCRAKKCMVYTYFESQKFIHPMSLVPNRTQRALGKAFAGKKNPRVHQVGHR